MQDGKSSVYSRQYVVDGLRRLGLPEMAEKALHELPERIDSDQLGRWGMRHGITLDDVISLMGGSP
jgi:hypothetical protein